MKKALIISVKFAPGLPKEFFLIGDHLNKYGWQVDYLLSSQYKDKLDKKYIINNIKYIDIIDSNMAKDYFINWKKFKMEIEESEIGQENNYSYVCVYNPHPLAGKLMKYFKRKNKNSVRSVVLHEPYVPIRERVKYGVMGIFKCCFLDYFSAKLILNCTDIIFPSENAKELYNKRKVLNMKKKGIHVIPLLLERRNDINLDKDSPPYISFVGTINKARGIDELFHIAEIIKKYNLDVKVSILTRQNVQNKNNSILVIKKDFITDEEISNFVRKSSALLLSHSVAAQSGNVPVAYRVGTPIICKPVKGITQHVEDGKTGAILYDKMNDFQIANLIKELINNQKIYEENCKKYFDEIFSEENFKSNYNWLLDT